MLFSNLPDFQHSAKQKERSNVLDALFVMQYQWILNPEHNNSKLHCCIVQIYIYIYLKPYDIFVRGTKKLSQAKSTL